MSSVEDPSDYDDEEDISEYGDEDEDEELEEGEDIDEKEEDEEAEEQEEMEVSTSKDEEEEGLLGEDEDDDDDPIPFVVKKKVKLEKIQIEPTHSIDEKNLITLCNTEVIPVGSSNYILWLNDIRVSLINIFSKGSKIFGFKVDLLEQLNTKICQNLLTKKVGYLITG